MQLENHKEESRNKSILLEKLETEGTQKRNENSQTKREADQVRKEINSLKLELDTSKNECSAMNKLNSDKSDKISFLEGRVSDLLEKVSDLAYKLERTKRSRPPSAIPSQDVKEKEKVSVVEESKKSNLDGVTSSGLTVREELEKAFANKFPAKNARPSISHELITKKHDEVVGGETLSSPLLKEKTSETIKSSRKDAEIIDVKDNEVKSPRDTSRIIETKPKLDTRPEGKININAKIEIKEIKSTNYKSLDIPKQESLSEPITFKFLNTRARVKTKVIEEPSKVTGLRKPNPNPPLPRPSAARKAFKVNKRPPRVLTKQSKAVDSSPHVKFLRDPPQNLQSPSLSNQKKPSLASKALSSLQTLRGS